MMKEDAENVTFAGHNNSQMNKEEPANNPLNGIEDGVQNNDHNAW